MIPGGFEKRPPRTVPPRPTVRESAVTLTVGQTFVQVMPYGSKMAFVAGKAPPPASAGTGSPSPSASPSPS